MRIAGWVAAVVLVATNGVAEEGWSQHSVPAETDAWHSLRVASTNESGRLSVRQEGDGNGFELPRIALPRREVSAEADIRVRQRLCSIGWNFTGVALYQDDANYWMLALVEGPEGKHTVDFIENRAGVWQAQSEQKTELKREGNVSFAWKSDTAYRLRLSFRNGKVCGDVSDPSNGHVIATASFALGGVPAVRSGRPGLIVHASAAVCDAFRFGLPEHPSQPAGVTLREGPLGHLALLDDALPGHDRAANARLAEVLTGKGFGVTRLTAEQLLAPEVLSGDTFALLVVPQCASLPAQAAEAVLRFAQEGGHLIFIGGPFLDQALWQIGGRWLDAAGVAAMLQDVVPAHRPFEIGAGLNLKAWRRSCQDSSIASTFRVVSEGPGSTPCLRTDIPELSGWDVRQSPELPALFGAGDAFFTFMGKGDAKTGQLAVEIIERDGSRWIATALLTTEWRRVGLRLRDFRYWRDSNTARKRGHAGDALNPSQAVRLCVGLSASHTAAVGAGAHTFWLADIGTARDPLSEAGVSGTETEVSIEDVYPHYKVYTLKGSVAVTMKSAASVSADGSRGPAFGTPAAKRASSLRCSDVVCAIPRMEGQGFGREGKWRFVPFAEANNGTTASGACEWLLLNNRMPFDGVAFAGFGYNDPAVWSSPEVSGRIAEMAVRLTQGAMIDEAGTVQFAYWPGEHVRLGAHVRAFGDNKPEPEITLEVRSGARVVWSERVKRPLMHGANACEFAWQPPSEPGAYICRVRLEDQSGAVDVVQHEFAVLDPAPAPKSAFITVRDGDFWLNGKPWYPVGINYWPLYVSGMDHSDYGSGWLRDAYYAPKLVERDLAQLQDMGVNMVSIQSPPPAEYRNLLDFLRLCGKYDIRVNLYVGQASPLAFNDAALKTLLETSRLPGNPTVFAYDTIWEPGNHVFKDDEARQRWDGEWRAWVDERYGSIANAEHDWGFKARRDKRGLVVSPADAQFREDGAWRGMMAAYRRFMDDLTSRLWGKANRRLRELDPNHLVSFRQGNTLPHDFALSGPVKHIDFICPEGYSIRDTDEGEDAIGFISRYVHHTTGGKPIVWSEFGTSVWDGARLAPDAEAIVRQGHYEERFYRTGLASGANGTVPWWWVGGYRVDERSDFGIVEPDRTERPSALLIRKYSPLFKVPRPKLATLSVFDFDRDAHAGGYWRAAFNEGATAYRSAARQGKMLDVRTQGTATDSGSVPPVAVGNVPCNGSNPPKYLDAEFNRLQILDTDGVWREAGDGVEITVAKGRPVQARASLGNLQEATWIAASGSGSAISDGVALTVRTADGKIVNAIPLKTNVAYLADADFGEFNLLPQVGQKVGLTVRLEAFGHLRTPFGEARMFTVLSR